MTDYTKGKYDSARDEVLHIMTLGLWGNESDGNVDSPAGYFSRVSNAPADIHEISLAFAEDAPVGFEWNSIIGHYLIREDDRGFIAVTEYPTEVALIGAYRALSDEYSEWLGDEDE